MNTMRYADNTTSMLVRKFDLVDPRHWARVEVPK